MQHLSHGAWKHIRIVNKYCVLGLNSLHPCTGYTEYKDIYNNLFVYAGIIEHIEEYYI